MEPTCVFLCDYLHTLSKGDIYTFVVLFKHEKPDLFLFFFFQTNFRVKTTFQQQIPKLLSQKKTVNNRQPLKGKPLGVSSVAGSSQDLDTESDADAEPSDCERPEVSTKVTLSLEDQVTA